MYEYKTWDRNRQSTEERKDTRTIVQLLNDFAKDGWEHYLIDGTVLYFRRSLSKDAKAVELNPVSNMVADLKLRPRK